MKIPKDWIFVFGSNREGRHGAGAALEAVRNYGAIYGKASGPQGRSYAIITTELRSSHPPVTLEQVREEVLDFIMFAKATPGKTFYVTPVGTGLAGFTREEIFPLFDEAPSNCVLTWKDERFAHLTK